MSKRRGTRKRHRNVKPFQLCRSANPEGVPIVRTVRCKPARRKVRYQVVYFDATGRQLAWAPNGPQRTQTLALRQLSRAAWPGDLVGYAVVRMVTVETVVRQTLLAKKVVGSRRREADGSR
jgi:hypothetical protein